MTQTFDFRDFRNALRDSRTILSLKRILKNFQY